MHYPEDPDSSSEEDSISIEEPSKERTFVYEEDIFEESQDETMLTPPIYLEESISEDMSWPFIPVPFIVPATPHQGRNAAFSIGKASVATIFESPPA